MKLTTFGILSLASIVFAEIQPYANDSPQETYVANFKGKIEGEVEFTGLSNGSIKVHVDLSNFPSYGSPFLYHVHEHAVPTNGNCTGTLGHLNPYNGNPSSNDTNQKEIGDLSGRYGLLKGDSDLTYVDQYLSLNPDSKAYIGNLSVVVHFNNATRYVCANITKLESTGTSNSTSTSNSTTGSNGTGVGNESGASISLYSSFALVLGALSALIF